MKEILALYYRLSLADSDKDEHDLSNSIKNQEVLLREYVKNHSDLLRYEMMEFYDDGFSGTSFQRPGIQKVFELMKQGRVKCIIVKDFSRFGRNYIDVGTYLEQIFPFLKVRFISVNDHFDSKKDNAAGAIDIGFKNLMHDYYSKNMGRKISQSKRFRAEQGTIIMPAFFGYKKAENDSGELVIDEEAANAVRLLFEKRSEGLSLRDIAKFMNEQGIFTPSERKVQLSGAKIPQTPFWRADMITSILKDIRYTGVFIFGKKHNINFKEKKMPEDNWIISKSRFEPIISRALFDKVNAMLYKRDTQNRVLNRSKTNALFCGRLQCGHCGRPLYKRDNGYKCKTSESISNSVCPNMIFKEEFFTGIVLQGLNKLIELMEVNNQCMDETAEDMNQHNKLQTSISKCQNDMICIYEKYADGKLTYQEYSAKRAELEDKRNTLKSVLDSLENRQRETAGKKRMSETLTANSTNGKIENLTTELLDILVDKIIVYDEEHIEIVWRFADVLKESKQVYDADAKRNAIYCRVCHNDGVSLKIQEKALKAFAENNGITNADVYSEFASGMNNKRSEFLRLMRDVKAGKIGVIYVKDLSRIAREHILLGEMLHTFQKYGVRLISMYEPFYSYDSQLAPY